MLYFFGIIAALGAIVAMTFGFYIVVYKIFSTEHADVDFGGYKIKGPVGIGVFLAGLAALVAIVWVYSKGVESENAMLTGQRDKAETRADEAEKAKGAQAIELDKARDEIQDQKKNSDQLARRLAEEIAARRDAEGFAKATWQNNNENALSPDQRAQLDRYNKGIDAFNADLTVLRIRPSPWPVIVGRKAIATYEVYRKDFDQDAVRPRGAGLFNFASEQFTLEGESAKGLTEELSSRLAQLICDASMAAIVNGVSPREAFARIPLLAQYESDGQRVTEVAELKYVMMRLQLLAADSLVLVRGYADGEDGPWEHPLNPAFKDVDLRENAFPERKPEEYALEFKPEPLSHIVLGRPTTYTTYGNVDLPNLRGEATQRIISALIQSCPPPANRQVGKIDVQVLEGRVYEAKSRVDRKSRVFLVIFLKEP